MPTNTHVNHTTPTHAQDTHGQPPTLKTPTDNHVNPRTLTYIPALTFAHKPPHGRFHRRTHTLARARPCTPTSAHVHPRNRARPRPRIPTYIHAHPCTPTHTHAPTDIHGQARNRHVTSARQARDRRETAVRQARKRPRDSRKTVAHGKARSVITRSLGNRRGPDGKEIIVATKQLERP